MKHFSDKKNIAFGFILTCLSLFVSLLGSFIITPFVLNGVGDKNYGLLSFCNSITTWLILVSESLGASYMFFATKEAGANKEERKTNTLFTKMFSFVGVLILVFTIAAVSILKISNFQFSKYSFDENNLIFLLLIISGSRVAVSTLFLIFNLFNNYKKSFIFVRSLVIACSILNYVCNLVIALTTRSIVLIAVTSLVFTFIQGLLNMVFAFKARKMSYAKVKIRDNKKEVGIIAKYSSVILLSSIIGNLDSNLDKTLLGIMVSAESVALYQLSVTFEIYLISLSWSLVEVMRPTLYQLYEEQRIEDANELYLKVSKIQSIIFFFIVGGFLACGYHFVTIWIGTNRIEVFFYTSALLVARIIPLTSSFNREAYRANDMNKIPLILSVISIVINLIISITLLVVLEDKYAIWACILGTIIPMFLIDCVLGQIICYKKLKLPINKYYLNILKQCIIAIVAISPALVFSIASRDFALNIIVKTIIEGILFTIVYLSAIAIFEKKTIKYFINSYLRKNKETNSLNHENPK